MRSSINARISTQICFTANNINFLFRAFLEYSIDVGFQLSILLECIEVKSGELKH